MSFISVIFLLAAGDFITMGAFAKHDRRKFGFILWLLLRLGVFAFMVYLTSDMQAIRGEGPLSLEQAALDDFDGEMRGLAIGIGLLSIFAIAESLISLFFLLAAPSNRNMTKQKVADVFK